MARLDPTFGDGGIVETEFAGHDTLSGIVVEPNGKIVGPVSGMTPDERSLLVLVGDLPAPLPASLL